MTPQEFDKQLTIGADPEFLFLDSKGNVASARALIPNDNGASHFGVDGAGMAGEIRPGPSTDPKVVVGNIQRALKSGARRIAATRKYKWVGGSTLHPIGGHIHFGTAKFGQVDYRHLAASLDHYLAIPLLAIECKSEATGRRMGSGYGSLGDMRAQNWGYEYRTAGSWITSPAVAISALSLAKVIACDALAGKILSEDLWAIDNNKFREAMISHKITDKAWERIKKMSLFKKYEEAIFPAEDLYRKGLTWQAGDLKETWDVLSPKLMAAIAAKKAAKEAREANLVKLSTVWAGLEPTLYVVRSGAMA